MDMRQLIAQIDHIENKQILNEDAHYTAAPVDNRPRVSKSNNQTSIYEMLIKEFGYDLGEQTLDEVAFSPEQQAKMGQANPQDPYIVARVLGKTAVPLSHFTDPADQAIAKQLGFKDGPTVAPAAPAGTAAQPAATPAVSNPQNPGGMSDEEMLARQNPGGMSDEEMLAQQQAAPAGTAAQPAPTTGGDTGEVPGVTTQPGAIPAAPTGTAAQPAKPAANKSMTPAITAYASRMGLLKDNKPDVAAIKKFQQDNGLKADGIIGPNTAGAILSAQKPGASSRGGPTAAQTAQAAQAAPAATKPAGTAAPTANLDAQLAKYKQYPQMNAKIIARLEKEKAALGSGIAAQPAATKSALPGVTGVPGAQISDTPAAESVRSQDDAILERIRTALFR